MKKVIKYLLIGILFAFCYTMCVVFFLSEYYTELNSINSNWQLFLFGFIFCLGILSFLNAKLLLYCDNRWIKSLSKKTKASLSVTAALCAAVSGRVFYRLVYVNADIFGKLIIQTIFCVFVQTILFVFVLVVEPNVTKKF